MVMAPDEKKVFIERVDRALDSCRSYLKVDKGDVEVVDVTDDMQVQIKWLGNCQACSISSFTIAGIEETLKNKIPEVSGVVALNGMG
jgi:Fe-S cluster biogenesis protein NfuA